VNQSKEVGGPSQTSLPYSYILEEVLLLSADHYEKGRPGRSSPSHTTPTLSDQNTNILNNDDSIHTDNSGNEIHYLIQHKYRTNRVLKRGHEGKR